ncbi:hypothetical protein PENSPDRAFT_678539 [Peniophora sp. CONT]|nr:hypothetical protein PENSPDRAFT_678539 [Peniophora sp. CONT]
MDPAAAETLQTAYSVMLLDDYTHTLDMLPTDLSRQFADLRELDAVLSSAVQLLIAKIDAFLLLLATPTTSLNDEERGRLVRDRQKMLAEIADDAARLKLGGEDKIRVACQAADQLRAHREQMSLELSQIPTFDTSALSQKTVYPHISDRAYPPLNYNDGNGRRRRGGNLLSTANTAGESGAASGNKRKRNKDDDDQGGASTPRKGPTRLEPALPRNKPANRSRKNERATSPTESILSVTSHQQPVASASAAQRNNRNNGAKPKGNARPPVPPGASHPSLQSNMGWEGRVLAGPGVAAPPTPQPEPVQTDDNAEVDERIYCICEQQSYGDMIACDADDCEKEWYHLVCVGLTVAPEGKWICDECLSKQQKSRGGQRSRNAKSRKSGGGGGARNGRGGNSTS